VISAFIAEENNRAEENTQENAFTKRKASKKTCKNKVRKKGRGALLL
jgi:hypothetical protein